MLTRPVALIVVISQDISNAFYANTNMAKTADTKAKPAPIVSLVASEVFVPEPPLEAVVVSLAGRAVAIPSIPPVAPTVLEASLGALPPRAMAADRKAAYVLVPLLGALMLPTMPVPQCVSCLQWNQMGLVSVTLIVKVEAVTRPESKPTGALELLGSAAK